MKLFIHFVKSVVPKPVLDRLRGAFYVGRSIPQIESYRSRIAGKQGIEIGGPSSLFFTKLPLYQVAKSVDGVNFSDSTIWEGEIQSGQSYGYYAGKKGVQYVGDAVDLSMIKSSSYDFLLSSNCLEHIANPLKALAEWGRVLKYGAALVLVLPRKESNFDHKRPVTSFEHLLQDFEANVSEQDLTHLDEILSLHDLSLDLAAGNLEEFAIRSRNNFENRTLHHHVFDIPLISTMLEHAGFEVINSQVTQTDFITLALKKNLGS